MTCCRTGGEEFLMLLPGASLGTAAAVAERLRVTVQETPIQPVGAVTLSLGWPTGTAGGDSNYESCTNCLYSW